MGDLRCGSERALPPVAIGELPMRHHPEAWLDSAGGGPGKRGGC